jgi:hypothetical protein
MHSITSLSLASFPMFLCLQQRRPAMFCSPRIGVTPAVYHLRVALNSVYASLGFIPLCTRIIAIPLENAQCAIYSVSLGLYLPLQRGNSLTVYGRTQNHPFLMRCAVLKLLGVPLCDCRVRSGPQRRAMARARFRSEKRRVRLRPRGP